VTHLLDTHAWIQRALGEPLPPLVERTLTEYADRLALADISLWEAAKLVEFGQLELCPRAYLRFLTGPERPGDSSPGQRVGRCPGFCVAKHPAP